MKRSLIAGLMLFVLGVSGNIARAQGGSSCDRECLRGFVTQYLNAMVAHNPAAWNNTFESFTRIRYGWTMGADWPRLAMIRDRWV